MAFKLKCSLANTTPSTEYFEGALNETFVYGEALTVSDGKLTKCTGDVKPEFVCLGDVICNEEGVLVPVMRVMDFYLFTCPVSGDSEELIMGDFVTIDGDGTGVTTTRTNGVAEIEEIDGNTVTVKF